MNEKKNFNDYTISEKAQYFRIKKWILICVEFLLLVIPFAILILVKKDEYFTQSNSIDLSIGCVLALIVVCIILAKRASFLKGVWGYLIAFVLAFLFRTIINDLLLILGVGLIGVVSKALIDSISLNKTKEICDAFNKAVLNKEVLNSSEQLIINEYGNAVHK